MYRTLDAGKIVTTIDQLELRIRERFPGAGLVQVCAELAFVARQTQERSRRIGGPQIGLRVAVATLLAAVAVLLAWVGIRVFGSTRTTDDLAGTIQGIDAGFNLLLLTGAALFFLFSLEERFKRRSALKALHELRSIIHVIDMHQLTKDPSTEVAAGRGTSSSPKRTLDAFQLVRYLDYCSEMLSLAAKVAVLYAQSFPDPVVTEAVNDLERTSVGLSQKIWQKISILEQTEGKRAMPG